jgi:protocatechuate 3,4-dioxygenase beta subunit
VPTGRTRSIGWSQGNGIHVQKTGFAVEVGGSPRTTITVTAGQTLQAPDLFLERGSAIAGRILDANGEPVTDARVVALAPRQPPAGVPARATNGPRLLPVGQPGRTNDLGEFRIFGLLPGEYVVAASLERSPFQTGSSSTTLATTYFPGVPAEESAQPVTVSAGQTTNGIDIRMASAAAFVVGGIVVTNDGQPVEGATVWLNTPSPGIGGPFLSHTDRSGRFQIGSVPPGAYRVSVSFPSSGGPPALQLAAPMNLTVRDSNIGGVRVVVAPRQ